MKFQPVLVVFDRFDFNVVDVFLEKAVSYEVVDELFPSPRYEVWRKNLKSRITHLEQTLGDSDVE